MRRSTVDTPTGVGPSRSFHELLKTVRLSGLEAAPRWASAVHQAVDPFPDTCSGAEGRPIVDQDVHAGSSPPPVTAAHRSAEGAGASSGEIVAHGRPSSSTSACKLTSRIRQVLFIQ